ncbi:MAG: ParA family protein [Herpetosiphon sp.]
MRLAFANQKGGVGKTTTAVTLGGTLATRGYRVLLVDIDPQGNAATCLGIDKRTLEASVGDVLLDRCPLHYAIIPTGRANFDLLPSTPDLAVSAVELGQLPERELRLRAMLVPISKQYDFVLIDCPPSLGLLTLNALAAAQRVIITLQCEYLALEGLAQLKDAIDLVHEEINPELHISGVVMTMFDGRVHLARQVVEEVRQFFPRRIFNTCIPRTVRLAEAPSHGQLIGEYDARSRGAQAYEALTDEFLGREGRQA